MADFIEEKQKQKRLIYVLLLMLVITGLVLWYGFFRQAGESEEIEIGAPEFAQPLQFDFSILERPLLKQLNDFEEIEPFEGEPGRENPFIPPP